MLQKTPDRQLALDPIADHNDGLCCALCHTPVTRQRWATVRGHGHHHHCTNPHGLRFAIRLFSKAPGVSAIGTATAEATWFPRTVWRLVLCQGCRGHLGWRYDGQDGDLFWGLIADRLRPCQNTL